MLAFTSHNVMLPDGSQTAPHRPLVANAAACRKALLWLSVEFGADQATVADLGCLEGGYAAEFARAGFIVTGIEARQENYDRAARLPEALDLPDLRFIHGDVWKVLAGKQYDAVFCSGLLYHMETPVAFCNLLGQVTRKLLILNTHVSQKDGHPENVHQAGSWCDYTPAENEGRRGHWFYEDDDRWAGYGNRASFWLAKDELLDVLSKAGFSEIREEGGWQEGFPFGSGGAFADRVMIVARKP